MKYIQYILTYNICNIYIYTISSKSIIHFKKCYIEHR